MSGSPTLPYDPVKARLQSLVDTAVRKFDAMGDLGFSDRQRAAMKAEPYRREMYRGYNIDGMVREAVKSDPELRSRISGSINNGPDFKDTVTRKTYEMTTKGALSGHRAKYGIELEHLDTSRVVPKSASSSTVRALPRLEGANIENMVERAARASSLPGSPDLLGGVDRGGGGPMNNWERDLE